MRTKFMGFASSDEVSEYGPCGWAKATRRHVVPFGVEVDPSARIIEVKVIRVIKPTKQKNGAYKFVRPKKES